jgi:hypothetical protein
MIAYAKAMTDEEVKAAAEHSRNQVDAVDQGRRGDNRAHAHRRGMF